MKRAGVCLRAGGRFSQQAAAEADKWSGKHGGKNAAAAHLAASGWTPRAIPALAGRSLFVWSLTFCLQATKIPFFYPEAVSVANETKRSPKFPRLHALVCTFR